MFRSHINETRECSFSGSSKCSLIANFPSNGSLNLFGTLFHDSAAVSVGTGIIRSLVLCILIICSFLSVVRKVSLMRGEL